MRAIYFDCFAGVSGDMIIGALVDLVVDAESLKAQLTSLNLSGCEIKTERVKRSGIAAVKFNVEVDQSAQPARSLDDIKEIINRSLLSEQVKARSIRAFELLAEAEARVHATTPDKVHFHEVGAVDSIIDTVGAMIGFEMLDVEKFFCSPMRIGHGSIETEHGRLPIPAPATAELLRGVPVYAGDIEGEFVTPTGAAIVVSLCEKFGPLPEIRIEKTGFGAGSRNPRGLPNALRLILGEVAQSSHLDGASLERIEMQSATPTRVMVIETNIDDMNPQVFGFVMDRAFELGALDAFLTPVQMKKSRPGNLLTILCEPLRLDAMIEMLLSETTTLGVRYYEAQRRVLERAIEFVETRYGCVRVKVARDGARTLHFQPEYKDCARIASDAGVPLIEVQSAASAAYRKRLNEEKDADEADDEFKEK